MERLILRFFPWWFMALISVNMLIWCGTTALNYRADAAYALETGNAPRPIVDIADFDQRTDVGERGEVRIRGVWRRDYGAPLLDTSSVKHNLLVMESEGSGGDYVVLVVPNYNLQKLADYLDTEEDGAGFVVINGHIEKSGEPKAVAAGVAKLALPSAPVALIEPFPGDWTAMMEHETSIKRVGMILAGAIGLLAGLSARSKYKRRQATKTARALEKKKQFDDSPIVSR